MALRWGQVLRSYIFIASWRTPRARKCRNARPDPPRLTGGGALRGGVDRVEGLAGGHEEAVALGPAEADVAADLGQADAPDELALRRPHRHPAVAHAAARVAGAPEIAVHVGAHAVRSALDAVHHEGAEELAVAELVVRAHVEHVHVALAARSRVARPLAGADHVELLEVGREAEPVGIGYLVFAYHLSEGAALVDAVHRGGQLALVAAELERLPELRVEPARHVGRSARRIHRALVELGPVGWVGEPVAPVRVRHHVVGRVEPLAVEHPRDEAHRAVELVAHHASGDVLAGELAALEVERIPVAVVRRRAEHADVAVVLDPPELPVVRDIAPHQVPALRVPRRPFRPERAGPQPLDRGVRLT